MPFCGNNGTGNGTGNGKSRPDDALNNMSLYPVVSRCGTNGTGFGTEFGIERETLALSHYCLDGTPWEGLALQGLTPTCPAKKAGNFPLRDTPEAVAAFFLSDVITPPVMPNSVMLRSIPEAWGQVIGHQETGTAFHLAEWIRWLPTPPTTIDIRRDRDVFGYFKHELILC